MLSRFGIFFGALALLQILGGHQSLVLDTDKWLVVLTGCGHAGLINILTYARQAVRHGAQVYAALAPTSDMTTSRYVIRVQEAV